MTSQTQTNPQNSQVGVYVPTQEVDINRTQRHRLNLAISSIRIMEVRELLKTYTAPKEDILSSVIWRLFYCDLYSMEFPSVKTRRIAAILKSQGFPITKEEVEQVLLGWCFNESQAVEYIKMLRGIVEDQILDSISVSQLAFKHKLKKNLQV